MDRVLKKKKCRRSTGGVRLEKVQKPANRSRQLATLIED